MKGIFIDINKAAEELIGYKKEEFVGKNFSKLKLIDRMEVGKVSKLLADNALGKPTCPDVFTLNKKDGSKVKVEIRINPVKIKGKAFVIGNVSDITDHKKLEWSFRESEERKRY